MISIGIGSLRGKAWWPVGAVMALDFGNDRYMRDQVSVGRDAVMSFARASTRLARNRAGSLLGFAPNAPALTDMGLSIEPAATNFALQSGRIDLPPWSQGQSTVTGYPAPDGSTNAAKLTQITPEANFRIQPVPATVVSGEQWTASLWMWATAPGTVRWTLYRDGTGPIENNSVQFNLSSTPQLCAVTHRFANNHTGVSLRLTWGGDKPVNDLYAWGGQVEKGAVATSSIVTMASPATRAADAADLHLPSGALDLLFTFDDGSTQLVAGVSGDYRIPTDLARAPIRTISVFP